MAVCSNTVLLVPTYKLGVEVNAGAVRFNVVELFCTVGERAQVQVEQKQ